MACLSVPRAQTQRWKALSHALLLPCLLCCACLRVIATGAAPLARLLCAHHCGPQQPSLKPPLAVGWHPYDKTSQDMMTNYFRKHCVHLRRWVKTRRAWNFPLTSVRLYTASLE